MRRHNYEKSNHSVFLTAENKNYSINFNDNFIGYNNKGIILTNKEIEILKRNDIEYQKYSSVTELLYEIDDVILDSDDEELELIANNIAERNYYLNTKK